MSNSKSWFNFFQSFIYTLVFKHKNDVTQCNYLLGNEKLFARQFIFDWSISHQLRLKMPLTSFQCSKERSIPHTWSWLLLVANRTECKAWDTLVWRNITLKNAFVLEMFFYSLYARWNNTTFCWFSLLLEQLMVTHMSGFTRVGEIIIIMESKGIRTRALTPRCVSRKKRASLVKMEN